MDWNIGVKNKMPWKKIETLVKEFPGLVDYLMFFKDGTVVQTSFKPPMNIPKMSESLLHICQDFQQFEEVCKYEKEEVVRHLFETVKYFIFILEFEDDLYLALILDKTAGGETKYNLLRKNLEWLEKKIEELKVSLVPEATPVPDTKPGTEPSVSP